MTSTTNARKVMMELVGLFSRESFPDIAAKTYITAPEVPSSSWSLGNRLVMMISGTADARGFRQWKNVGRNIKSGSKATYILGPRLVNADDPEDPDRKILVGFRAIPVFRYEDTYGAALESYKPRELPPLFELAELNGINVRYANSTFGEYGSITHDGKHIVLSTDSPDTFLHELVHFYDFKNNGIKSGQNKVQEIVAQLGACILARMYNVDKGKVITKYTWKYISHYADTDSSEKIGRECMAVLGRVDEAINLILADAVRTQCRHQLRQSE